MENNGTLDREGLIESLLDSSYDGIFITDGNGFILKASKAMERMTNLLMAKIIGKNVLDLIRKGILPENAVTAKVLKSKARMSTVLEFEDKVLLATATPYFDSDRNIKYVICNVRDLTELETLRSESRKMLNNDAFRLGEIHASEVLLKITSCGIGNVLLKDKKMIDILKKVLFLKDYNLKYLISGETGTGKGLLAKIIHYIGNRKDAPFVEVNCSTIPSELFESEVFGYTEGSFSGAKKMGQKGLIESAHGGTVFFDEIGTMPLQMQSKLLKFLDDGRVKRLGTPHGIDVNVQIISATNAPLKREIQSGNFREDLYFRLNEIPIHIPPLRDRPEDIKHMAEWFWNHWCTIFNRKVECSIPVLECLNSYRYPGNVRELDNIIKNLILNATTPVVNLEALPDDITSASQNAVSSLPTLSVDSSFSDMITSVEKNIIMNAYKKYGSTYKAAQALGMNQSTFYRRAKKYRLEA